MFHDIDGEGYVELILVLHLRQIFNGASNVREPGLCKKTLARFDLFHFDVNGIDGDKGRPGRAIVRVLAESRTGIEDAEGLLLPAKKRPERALDVPLSQKHQSKQLVEQLAPQDAVANNAADDSFNGIVLQINEKLKMKKWKCQNLESVNRKS
jgi:hypothetical protein